MEAEVCWSEEVALRRVFLCNLTLQTRCGHCEDPSCSAATPDSSLLLHLNSNAFKLPHCWIQIYSLCHIERKLHHGDIVDVREGFQSQIDNKSEFVNSCWDCCFDLKQSWMNLPIIVVCSLPRKTTFRELGA